MSTSRERVAQNFVNRYGLDGLNSLLRALEAGDSGQAIAERFEVSRERVRQWKNAFGTVITMYQVHPTIRRLAENKGSTEVS